MNAVTKDTVKDERRREILDAAFLEFSDKGYSGASMAAIARRARASKETLYAWFENKETLFNTVFAARLENLSSRDAGAFDADPAPANVLPVIAEDIIRFMLAITPLFQSSANLLAGKRAGRVVGKTIAEDRRKFVDYIVWCRDQGYIEFDDDPFEITSLFVAMAQGEWSLRLATGMLGRLTDEMIEAHAQRVTNMFLKALAPVNRGG